MNTALYIEKLYKIYSNNTKALNGISLQVKKHDFFALLGPNGAGKSTTIGIICSLIRKTSGYVSILGHDIDKKWFSARSKLGIVPQEFNFNVFERTEDVLINQAGYYGLSRSKSRTKAEYYMKKLGLWHKKDASVRSLSGGMKRRLMIIKALIHQPSLLILDEPTAGIDIELRRQVWSFLKEINASGTTIILTTHYLEEAENLCENVAIINNGEIIATNTVSELIGKLKQETFICYSEQRLNKNINIPFKYTIINDYEFEVILPRTISINEFFSQLTANNITITSLRNKTNRLEETFVNITARDN